MPQNFIFDKLSDKKNRLKIALQVSKLGFSPIVMPEGRTPPLEAILVIFGRRALIFFLLESSWKKMKNDTTFVRMRSGDQLGDAKMSKKGTSLRRILLFY